MLFFKAIAVNSRNCSDIGIYKFFVGVFFDCIKRGCSFLWSPKETNQRKALRHKVSKDFRMRALTYLSRVINKSDGGAPNGVC